MHSYTVEFQSPPASGTPLDDPAWEAYFRAQWEATGRDGQGTFNKLQIIGDEGAATFDTPNMNQDLLTVDKGLYVNYSSGNSNIIYGYACNVRRFSGQMLTVAAQLNAYAGRGCHAGVWGAATTAVAEVGSLAGVCGIEVNPAPLDPANTSIKTGFSAVFKNRGDGVSTAPGGLGADMYSQNAWTFFIDSQPRSSAGEKCGWNVGMQFLSGCFDAATPRAWSAAASYTRGEVVSSGGLLWKAQAPSTNQLPAAPSAYWVQHTYAGTNQLAIGLDFSCLDLTTLGRMAAAIRLRDTLPIQWDVTGSIGTFFDPVTSRLAVVDNQGTRWLEVDVTNGFLYRNGVFLI